jgi:hypothetical protein
MPGMTSRVAWKAELRLIARMASHFSAGNCSSGATNWMPALLTRMSTLPNAAPAPSDQAGDRSRPAHVGAVEADFASRFLGQAGADRLDLVGLAEAIQHDLGAGESQRPGEAEAMPLVEPVTMAARPSRGRGDGAAGLVSGLVINMASLLRAITFRAYFG